MSWDRAGGPDPSPGPPPAVPSGGVATLAAALFELAAARDVDGAVDLATSALSEGPAADVVDALSRVQERVGGEWYRGTWTVADEHAATGVVDAALAAVQATRPPGGPRTGPLVVVACPEGEWHSLPARMLSVRLRHLGARVTFLGASMPADHLGADLAHRRPDVLAVSVATPLGLPAAIASIDAAHAVRVPVVLGGGALGTDERRAGALGADGWAANAADLVRALPIAPRVHDLGSRAARQSAVFALELDRDRLVGRALEILAGRFPPIAHYDHRQLQRTREDLESIARFVEVSVLVDDSWLFTEFVDWLHGLLSARGLPRTALPTSLDCLADASGPGLVEERTRAAAAWLRTHG